MILRNQQKYCNDRQQWRKVNANHYPCGMMANNVCRVGKRHSRLNILLTGKVWLGVLSGKTQPPVFVSGESVFVKEPLKARFLAFLAEVKESIIEAWESTKEAAKQPDKRKHFFVGVLISLVIGTLLGWWVGFTAGSLAGICKEWWDSKGHGTVEVMDVVFTMIGAACAIPLSLLFYFLIW